MSATVATLAILTALVAVGSLALSPRAHTVASFFQGHDSSGAPPGLLAITFSQVTTWIFARSIMNAAILGYAFGIGGALAYAAYYLSFFTGSWIVSSLRFRHGFSSVQAFLASRFGDVGTTTYNFVVAIRLLSEVFANLLVIGLIFGTDGSTVYIASILLVGLVTLGYSLIGGLNASIRTDMFQMSLFLVVLTALILVAVSQGGVDLAAIAATSGELSDAGWVLLAVAFLQIWSYPLHDPVMMDRGFIADRRTTIASFYHAGWISLLCILAFGMIGVWAGLEKADGETFVISLARLIGDWPMFLFNLTLIISCMSTLDSTFSSAAKLTIVDMRAAGATVRNGRTAMALFLIGGLAMVFLGSKDLFAAVAVSGTASLFLAPVVFFSLWGGRTDVPVWSYLTGFVAAMTAAVLYFTESSGYTNLVAPLTGVTHKYSILLVLCVLTLSIGFAAFTIGLITRQTRRQR